MAELTPLMKQYFDIKKDYPDAILFFRLGDFYEMFGEDAKTASKILQITLTTRDKGKEQPIPMCGVPHFSAEGYITKLIKAGYKVAICEQVEDPKAAKGIVKREVVRVVTPGTHQPENPKLNNFILSFYPSGRYHGIAVADLSTGEFIVYETESPVEDELNRFEPKEVLCPESLMEDIHYSSLLGDYYVTYWDNWFFEFQEAYRRLLEYYRVYSLGAFGIEEQRAAISAAGALLGYLSENERGSVVLRPPTGLKQGIYMFLDGVTKRNLELLHNLRDGTEEGTLISVLDETLTPMGGRFLRQAILRPLKDIGLINRRLEAVENLVDDFEMREGLRRYLRDIHDIERLSTRVLQRRATPRELVTIKNSLKDLPRIKGLLGRASSELIKSLNGRIGDFKELYSLIDEALVDDPPHSLNEGGIIRSGYRYDIDELRELATSGKDYIASLEAKERQKTGISSLKIGYNRVFGYYIEVTKSNLHLVPEHYIRKQTLVGSERFITEELKDYESKVLGAEERLKALEKEVYNELLERVAHYAEGLLDAASAIAEIDFLLSLSTVATRNNYTRPTVEDSGELEIIEGRHPVLERLSFEERFIANNTYMDREDNRLLIITGPNMAGKSTYMRQVALIVLMAQMGSFVPAQSARIGVVDRIFTRIGASDYLAKGQSTFMVEMIETANILNNATEQSLIILDEVGRGTSTFDGISIAWAVAEYIVKRIGARTLFATHYNELTELSMALEGVKNYNVTVKEWGDEIIFLRKIERGPADKSYGIQVARLAGLPEEVIKKAREVLGNLEQAEFSNKGLPRVLGPKYTPAAQQLDLFAPNYEPVIKKLMDIDFESLTPEEAIKKLKQLKRLAEKIS
ncbi:MAG: DNA mismatch repair protein MutS [Nitrospirae bacterium]|nr:MAG: DNA mismatch repair protein MutS [Nitrospirota bacterium]